jgi:hypothetical protein
MKGRNGQISRKGASAGRLQIYYVIFVSWNKKILKMFFNNDSPSVCVEITGKFAEGVKMLNLA